MTTKKNSSRTPAQPALPTGASASANVSATVVLITPAIAGEMLKHNTQNRPVSDTQVDLFAKLIAEGSWRLTHQGIAFDSRGGLIDGQHRLRGIIAAGIAVPAMVVRGLDHGAIEAVDTGLVRRAHHGRHLFGAAREHHREGLTVGGPGRAITHVGGESIGVSHDVTVMERRSTRRKHRIFGSHDRRLPAWRGCWHTRALAATLGTCLTYPCRF